MDQRDTVRLSGHLLPIRRRPFGGEIATTAPHPTVLRRLLASSNRGGGQARGCLCTVGRDVRTGPRGGQTGACRSRQTWPYHSLQPVVTSDSRRNRREGLGPRR